MHAGISWSAVAQVESGRRTNLRPSTLAALSRPLGVSIDYLVDGPRSHPAMLEHSLFPYSSDDQFRVTMGSFLTEGVARSEVTLAVTTSPHIELLREQLGGDAASVEFVEASRFYTTPIAAVDAYRSFFGRAFERGVPWVRVLAEPMRAGLTDAEAWAWTQYESLFNLVFAASPSTVVCAYDERTVSPETAREARLTHPSTFGRRGVLENPAYTDPARLIF